MVLHLQNEFEKFIRTEDVKEQRKYRLAEGVVRM